MRKLFRNLLVSAPNNGGLFLVTNGRAYKLDSFNTTGLSLARRLFLRAQQNPPTLWICNERETAELGNALVAFDDIHDVVCHGEHIYLVSSAQNAIVKLDRTGLELQRWVFPGEKDSRHINCLGIWQNRIHFSAFGDFAETRGYKGRTLENGYVQDLLSGQRPVVGLSQPHSLAPVGENLLIANSELKEIREYAPDGKLLRARTLDGYTRGICVSDDVTYVGLSKSRNIEDSDLGTAIVVILDSESWTELGRLSLPTNEIYSVLELSDASSLSELLAKIAGHSSSKQDSELVLLRQTVSEQSAQTAAITEAVAQRDALVAERDGQIVALNQALSERDKQIASLNLTVTERDGQIADLKQTHLAQARRLEAQIEGYKSSRSWRLTAPLRAGRRLVDSVIRGLWFRAALSQAAQFAYRRLPLRTTTKVSIKASIFRKFGALFRDTVSYQRWEALESGHAEPYRMRLAAENADEYVPLSESSIGNSSIKLIAFYLPQYHPIPENDAWWGKGFTEWTNVTRTQPQFRGHYQPHLPGELGFYDLRLIEIQKRQIELARHFGIYGFCYHHYWFGGKRLLERPFNQVLANKELDLPFCICWANENWSRRWDGLDHEVLVAQSHSPEDDIALLRDIEPALRDDRYIRVNGKPLLMVYRPALLPDVRATAERWREYGRTAGLGDLYLVSTHAFDNHDPRDFGFDAAIEFPPNNFPAPVINEQMQLLNPDYRGIIYDYRYFLEHSRRYKRPDYTLYRGVCPSWDNEARMPGRGTTFAYSSPRAYREWLHNACRYTVDNFDAEHRLVFVNAWNEWAEGAHLEPDRKYGYAYLQATADALRAFPKSAASGRVVLVSHDAHFNGAQLNALNIVRSLTQDFGYIVDVILCGPGPLTEEFSRHATVHEFFGPNATRARLAAIVDELKRKQVSHCICNTSVVGDVCEALKNGGARVITLVHELPGIIQTYSLQDSIYKIAAHSDEVVFAAQMVRDAFRSLTNLDIRKTVILPQGLYQRNSFRDRVEDARKLVRQELGLGATTKIVLGVGFADFRKGVDFFVDVALRMIETRSDICFLWVGDCEPGMWTSIAPRIAGDLNSKRIRFVGRRTDPGAYFAGADIYLMTSREDPFPSVVLEALDVGVPVIGFEGAGGFCDLIGDRLGALVPAGDIGQMAGAVDSLLTDQDRHRRISIDARGIMEKQFDFRDYVHGLISHLGFHRPRVSVVVPNYNYARYLPERLESIFRQTYAPYEIIFLDDCSTDESVNVAEPLLKRSGIPYRLVLNSKNQGTYQQWLRGFKEAKGELIWLAEADDVCEPRLLERLVKAFEDRDVVLAYCQSKQIDDRGHVLANSYLVYTQDIEPDKWTRPYARNGEEEIRDSLAIKNTIPNVSATLIRRMELTDLEDRLVRFKASGDWYLYIYLLSHGKIAFDPEPLNSHRRHPRGVILGGKSEILMKEMVEIQEEVLSKHSVSQETLHKIKEIRQSTYLRLGLHRKGPPNFEDSIFAPHHAPELRLPATSTTQS